MFGWEDCDSLECACLEINFISLALAERLGFTGEARQHFALLLSNLLVLAILPLAGFLPHVCAFQYFLGIPCPGCDITTAVSDLLHLHFNASLMANPAGVFVAAVVAYQLGARPLALLRSGAGPLVSQYSRRLSALAVAFLFVVWFLRISGGLLNARS